MNAWTVKECHITVGSSRPLIGRWRDNSPPSPPLSSQHHRRLGRQGLARRRDTSSSSTSATSGSVASTWQKSHMLTGMCHLLSSDLFGSVMSYQKLLMDPGNPFIWLVSGAFSPGLKRDRE